MLHNLNSSEPFPMLLAALRAIGVPEETIAIIPDYLDTSKPRNDALLDGIQPDWYPGDSNTERDFSKAMRGEIFLTDLPHDKQQDAYELRQRWLLLSYAIAGNHCNELGTSWGIVDEKTMDTLFSARYGKAGEARAYAFRLTDLARLHNFMWLRDLTVKPPEVCLAAIGFTDSYKAKMALLLILLSGCKAPQKGIKGLFAKPDPILPVGLQLLAALYQDSTSRVQCSELVGATVAMAASLSDSFHKLLMQHHQRERYNIAEFIVYTGIGMEPVLGQLDQMTQNTAQYVTYLAGLQTEPFNSKVHLSYSHTGVLPTRDAHLRAVAAADPDGYLQALQNESEVRQRKLLADIFREVHPDAKLEDMQQRAKEQCLRALCYDNDPYKNDITLFLTGVDSMEQFLTIEPKLRHNVDLWREKGAKYVEAYGLDDFAERCICFQAMVNFKDTYGMIRVPGWDDVRQLPETLALFDKHGVPLHSLLNFCGNITWQPGKGDDPILSRLTPRAAEIAALDPSVLCAEGRKLAMHILHETGNLDALFVYAEDPGKGVRADLCTYLPLPGGDYDEQYRQLLAAKKQGKREVAVTMLEKSCPDSLKDAVQAAFEKEKNAGLQTRLAVLLGEAAPPSAEETASSDLVSSLTKGNKAKKVDFLFDKPFSPVRKADGTPADETILKALAVSYAEQVPPGRSRGAVQIAEGLNAADLEAFAGEVFARWIALGAPAKTKWVLYLASIHGGTDMLQSLQHYIKDWAEHARGAIAAEAANALALNGSSPALMAVDSMARKFKNKQVRAAAGNALQAAADGLGITREELADRIVPDLGFDEHLCRVFDFGTRQFKVYLTPALELEIFEGEKKLKNLPKPGVKDDTAQAEAAVKAFKDMKKQMKAAIQSQTQRLEYALLCDRKWTTDGWRALFIRKPVMHCFAIGLIWGVYENGTLVQSFRYMEDGSFNTPDEDEYELPEQAVIGLVHPLELDEETRQTWAEQLTDYEIKQPFPQIGRQVYRVTDEERTETALRRFSDRELVAITLLGRMTKVGWDKGYPGDGGMFCEFLRNDISRQYQNAAGEIVREGFHAELHFSGMFIDGYDNMDSVQIEQVEFRRLNGGSSLPLGELPPRYFSEIVYQLTSVLGVSESTEDPEET